jgi:hypothetical protein
MNKDYSKWYWKVYRWFRWEAKYFPLRFIENEFNWKLIRERDGLLKQSKEVMWVEFEKSTGRFKSKHDEPAVDRSLIMSPFNDNFTWQTTPITEIMEHKKNYIKFKTKNSNYELYKIQE